MSDFNIYDLFKNNALEGGSSDAGIILVQNLEKKVFKKFDYADDKIKKLEEENFKMKKETDNLKVTIEGNKQLSNMNKEEIEKLKDNAILTKKDIEEVKEKGKTKDDENYDKLILIMEDHVKNINNQLLQKDELIKQIELNNLEKQFTSSKSSEVNPEGNHLTKELFKRLMELEKGFKIFTSSINIDYIKNECAKMLELINLKADSRDLFDLRENTSN